MSEPGRGLLSAAPAKLDGCVMAGCTSQCRSANYGGVSGRAWPLCNWDVKEGMGGYCALPSVSILGCGRWEFWQRERQTEDVQGDIWGTSAGHRPARQMGKTWRGWPPLTLCLYGAAVSGNCIHSQMFCAPVMHLKVTGLVLSNQIGCEV